jgi:hypothetical protein
MAKRGKSTDSKENLAKKIWLAGVGAYGRSLNEAQQQVSRATGDTLRVFSELVERGEKIEKAARETIEDAAKGTIVERTVERMGEAQEKMAEARARNLQPVEDLISRVRDNMGLAGAGTASNNSAIEQRLDDISRQLADLTAAVEKLAANQARKAPARKTPARKAKPGKPAGKADK